MGHSYAETNKLDLQGSGLNLKSAYGGSYIQNTFGIPVLIYSIDVILLLCTAVYFKVYLSNTDIQ